MLARTNEPAKPPIFVTEADYERLWSFVGDPVSPGATLLRKELERATVVKEGGARRPFVRLRSQVEFTDPASGRIRTVTLVEPAEADIDADRLSVLAPAGAALLGLRPGETFSWTAADGRPRVLVVNRVAGPSAADPSLPAGGVRYFARGAL